MNRAQIRGTAGGERHRWRGHRDTDARMQHLREGPESVSQHHRLVDVAQSGQEGDRVEGCAAGISRRHHLVEVTAGDNLGVRCPAVLTSRRPSNTLVCGFRRIQLGLGT